MNLLASLQGIVDLLNSVDGLNATMDLRDLNTDGIYVKLESLSHEYLCGQAEMTVSLFLVTADVGTPQALDNLSNMLNKVLTVVDPDGDTQVGVIPALQGGEPHPALIVTVKVATS